MDGHIEQLLRALATEEREGSAKQASRLRAELFETLADERVQTRRELEAAASAADM